MPGTAEQEAKPATAIVRSTGICLRCGSPIIGRKTTAKYCSGECRDEQTNENWRLRKAEAGRNARAAARVGRRRLRCAACGERPRYGMWTKCAKCLDLRGRSKKMWRVRKGMAERRRQQQGEAGAIVRSTAKPVSAAERPHG
jgi:hypothetical protein